MMNKVIWISDLRVISTIAVIIIHVCGSFYLSNNVNSAWWVGNIFDSVTRFCVPIFVMISGALLLPKEYELTLFFKKKTLRIIFPFLFWSLFYIVFYIFRKTHHGESFTFLLTLKFIVLNLLICPRFSYHLWYIYMLIGLYLFIPIIGKWVRNASNKEIEYFLFIWVLTLCLIYTKIGTEFFDGFGLKYFSGYLGYLILGYYLSNKELKCSKKSILLISILFILIGALITIFGTWVFYFNKGINNSPLYDYLSPNVTLVSVGIFLFFKNISYNSPIIVNKMRDFIDNYSFGIYLVHVFVLESLLKYKLDLNFWSIRGSYPVIGIISTVLFCLCISIAIIFILNKLPCGKYVSGVNIKQKRNDQILKF